MSLSLSVFLASLTLKRQLPLGRRETLRKLKVALLSTFRILTTSFVWKSWPASTQRKKSSSRKGSVSKRKVCNLLKVSSHQRSPKIQICSSRSTTSRRKSKQTGSWVTHRRRFSASETSKESNTKPNSLQIVAADVTLSTTLCKCLCTSDSQCEPKSCANKTTLHSFMLKGKLRKETRLSVMQWLHPLINHRPNWRARFIEWASYLVTSDSRHLKLWTWLILGPFCLQKEEKDSPTEVATIKTLWVKLCIVWTIRHSRRDLIRTLHKGMRSGQLRQVFSQSLLKSSRAQ